MVEKLKSGVVRICLDCGAILLGTIEEHHDKTGHSVFYQHEDGMACLNCKHYFKKSELPDICHKLAAECGLAMTKIIMTNLIMAR